MPPIGLSHAFIAISADMRRIVYVSPVSWRSPRQRPHHFVDWAARVLGSEVLWVDPTPSRLPQLSDLCRAREPWCRAFAASQPDWLHLVRPSLLPVDPLPGLRMLNIPGNRAVLRAMRAFSFGASDTTLVIGKPSALAVSAVRHLGIPSVYDAMDAFPAFYRGWSREHIQCMEEYLIQSTTSLWVSSDSLYECWCGQRPDVQLVLNGVPASCELPEDDPMASPSGPFGYVGTIARWFDWPWLIRLAHLMPGRAIEIVGPNYSSVPKDLPPNIRLFGARPYAWSMRRMQTWSAGLIPFLRNELTDRVDPVKYYEYRAAGLPVISTAFGSMRQRGTTDGVLLVTDPGNMPDPSSVIERLALTRAQRADFICRNSWDVRFGAVQWHR